MKTFLDIRDRVQYDDKENEEGLLGLAFHPKYKENGEFFVYYLKGKPNPRASASVPDLAIPRFEGRSQSRRSGQRRGDHANQAAVLES